MKKIPGLGILILAILGGCSAQKNTTGEPPGFAGRFAFIEYFQTVEGRAIKGNIPVGRRIDSPTYFFDTESDSLYVYRYNSGLVSDSLLGVLGTGKILRGTAGSGVASALIGIEKLPFSYAGIEIGKIDTEKITFRFKGKSVALKEGEEWNSISTSMDTIDNSVVETTVAVKIQFHGFLPIPMLKMK